MATFDLEARLNNLLATAKKETKDIDLFAPIMEREECPICLIPFSIETQENVFHSCCGNFICTGCIFRSLETDVEKNGKNSEKNGICALCRQTCKSSYTKALKKLMKKNNPYAFIQMAHEHKSGERVLRSDRKALEMYIRAAEIGGNYGYAFEKIGHYIFGGFAVEADTTKANEFYQVAAKTGSITAHMVLASHENEGSRTCIEKLTRCNGHLKVAASAGDQGAMDTLMNTYKTHKDKYLSKEELSQTLRAFQTSKNLMKSKDRDEAFAFRSANSSIFNH